MSDPYDSEEFPPVGPQKGAKGKGARLALDPGVPREGDDLDVWLGFQPMNDYGNGQRLYHRFGEDMMFVRNIGWFVWDGARWDRERGEGDSVKIAHKVALSVRDEAKAVEKSQGKDYADMVGKLFMHASQTGNMAKVHGMLGAAAPYLSQPVEVLDALPMRVAAPNGTVAIGSIVELVESRREDRITRVIGVAYNTKAACERWEDFIARVLPDADVRDFMQRFMGYCLTGDTSAHLLLILYGTGRNGKTVFMNIMRRIFADYATSLPAASILAKNQNASGAEATPDLAGLPGIRLVTVSEPPENGRLDESRIKEITGGEHTMKVRHLNQGFFEFKPQFKMMIATNHRPVIRGTDKGIWSRIALIPFTAQIPESEIDPRLEEKLWDQADGILQWLLTGAEQWRDRGIALPKAIRDAVEDYRADQDPVGEFLKARCELDTVDPSTGRLYESSSASLYKAYKAWCDEEALDPLTGRTFGVKLAGRGITKRKSNGNTIYVGVAPMRDMLAGASE